MPHESLSPYLILPDQMIHAYADDPLSIAIYTGIARCCIAQRGPVPLSAPDLAQWLGFTGEPGRVTVMRRIQRLTADGWIVATAKPGGKAVLTPTWGRGRDERIRTWDWKQRDRGRPNWQRGRRIPLALFDDLIGRLVPHPTQHADLHSWWSVPLLDGKDLGTWMIGQKQNIVLTPRLIHLGLANTTLHSLDDLRTQARAGLLTTLDMQGSVITVSEDMAHQTKLSPTRSRSRRSTRSVRGSAAPINQALDSELPTASECGRAVDDRSHPSIAWDHELINNMIPPTDSDLETRGSGDDRSAGILEPRIPQSETTNNSELHQLPLADCIFRHNDQGIMDGHLALNPGMEIPIGEWLELADLERQHGVARMLIWQARAQRRTQAASGRVIPAYYRACAEREAADLYQPPRYAITPPQTTPGLRVAEEMTSSKIAPAGLLPYQRTAAIPARLAISPEADELLRAMGIRQRHTLADVPLELIRQWQPLVEHSALVARFPRDHRGWIWTQLRDQMEPPSAEELAYWLQASGAYTPPDWQAIAEESEGLVRMGDDLDGLPDLPDFLIEPPSAIAPPSAMPLPDELAEQFCAEVRLRSGDRALRQAVGRVQINPCGDDLLLHCSTADLRLLLAHSAVLRAAAAGVNHPGIVRCIAT